MFNLVDSGDLRKWVRFVLSCATAAFISFWGTFATVGGSLLYAGNTPWLSFCGGIFAGAGAMAGAVLATARANEMWKELTVILPKQSPASNPESRTPIPEDQSTRPPALTG